MAVMISWLIGTIVLFAGPPEAVMRADFELNAAGKWDLKSLPTAEQVIATDPLVRQYLQEVLAKIAKESPKERWNLNITGQGSFILRVNNEMRTKVSPFKLQTPREGTDAVSKRELLAVVGTPVPQVVVRKELVISIRVHGSREIAAQPVETTLGELERRGLLKEGLSAEERGYRVEVAGPEGAKGSGISWANSKEHDHALRLAAFAFESAKRHELSSTLPSGVEGGDSKPSGDVRAEITKHAHERFQLSGDWKVPDDPNATQKRFEVDVTSRMETSSPWKITVHLQAIEKATIFIDSIRVRGETKDAGDFAFLAEKKTKLEAELADKLGANGKDLLSRHNGHLVTREEYLPWVDEVTKELKAEPKIVEAVAEAKFGTVTFKPVWQPRETELKGSLGWSSDKGLGGSLALSIRNPLWVDNAQLDLSVEAGTEEQGGKFSYGIPYYQSPDGHLTSRLDLTASYVRDDDQKLGAPEDPSLEEERITAAVKNTLRYWFTRIDDAAEKAAAKTKEAAVGWRYSLALETSMGISDTRLDGPQEIRDEVEDGRVLYFLVDAKQRWWRKLRLRDEPGIGATELNWDLRVKKGIEGGLGDFDFFSGNTEVSGTVYFGSKTSRDYLVRLTVGGALVTGSAPVFEEFRLGGESTVRGLEAGERLAREAVYETIEFGISLERLSQIVPGLDKLMPPETEKKGAGSDAREAGPDPKPPGGFDLKGSYLAMFLDHAYIAEESSRKDARKGSRSVESLGAALQIPLGTEDARPGDLRGRLVLGYAWSPDSDIHQYGRVFAAVKLDF
jgi:hypothetical protein